jgi:hypothetical protein
MRERSDERRSSRILTAALLASVFVHVLGFLLYGLASQRFAHLRFPVALPTQQPDAIVTLSSAVTISKRAHPQPRPLPRPQAPPPRRPSRPNPQRLASVPAPPVPVAIPRPVDQPAPRSRALHELARAAPTAAPQPPVTVKATPQPKPAPSTPAQGTSKQVAFVHHDAQSPARPSQLSQAQIAHMNETFSKTLAELRRESDPLDVHDAAASATKRYRMQMIGINGDLKNGQGFYAPIKSWRADGYNYYYVSYEFTWSDGTYERGGVPWPIRFRPKEDPFANPGNDALAHVQLPPPLPGWKLPPGIKPGKALEAVFPDELRAASQ